LIYSYYPQKAGFSPHKKMKPTPRGRFRNLLTTAFQITQISDQTEAVDQSTRRQRYVEFTLIVYAITDKSNGESP
jgi:hypothetical protein